jgi:acetyltransferase-like isoleucine patch superfamily enzyme
MHASGPRSAAKELALRLRALRPLREGMRVELGCGVQVQGRVWVPGPGVVRLGDRVRLDGRRCAIELRAHPGGEIVIDEDVVIEGGASIEATIGVHVGARAHIGPLCKIIDNHFHRVTGRRIDRPEGVPVELAPDSIIGPRAVILPGASMGAGAWLGPACVLSFRLPAGAAFSGALHA